MGWGWWILRLLKLCVIGFLFTVQRSTGLDIPSPAILSPISPIEPTSGPIYHQKPGGSEAPSPASHPEGSNLHPTPAIAPIPANSIPQPQIGRNHEPSSSPSSPIDFPPQHISPPLVSPPPLSLTPPPSSTPRNPKISPSNDRALPPFTAHVVAPRKAPVALPPVVHERNSTEHRPSITKPVTPLVSPPLLSSTPPPSPTPVNPKISPLNDRAPPPFTARGVAPRKAPVALSPVVHERHSTEHTPPITKPIAPVASPPWKSRANSPIVHPINSGISPAVLPGPAASPARKVPLHPPAVLPVVPGEPPSSLPDHNVPPPLTPPTSTDKRKDVPAVAEPPKRVPNRTPPRHSPPQAPSPYKPPRHSNDAPVSPLASRSYPVDRGHHSPVSSPLMSFPKHRHARNKSFISPAPASSNFISPTASIQKGPVVAPTVLPSGRRRHHAPIPLNPVSPSLLPFPPFSSHLSPAPSPTPSDTSAQTTMPISPPKISPSTSSVKHPKKPIPPPIRALPPPPPNEDCSDTICTEPYTNTPPGSPCGCVQPMQVGLRLSVALYTFFPLVSRLASEIAVGVFMKQSQVRIIGANAAVQQPEKTVVLIDLVPLGEKFDNTTAFLTYYRFWQKQVVINPSLFGDYEVLYVRYPGLPPSPPSAPSGSGMVDADPYSRNGDNGGAIKPEGVEVPKRHHKKGINGSTIAIIVMSAFVAVVLCSSVAWVLLFKYRDRMAPNPQPSQSFHAKPSVATGSMVGSGMDSASLSFGSSIATYTGSAKTFSASEIEKATHNFDDSRILGEGGFGRVYSGLLEDGNEVAVKVLKRVDQQGGREFLAEVEMLSRLHHRNLVKLIGICIEEQARCLVYELIPNGSVESHLHGVDKGLAPLGWDARLKIALGAARALAYLHEDSNPRVIHRDFKASNILLEHDFTPKVSDFGLARTAMDEEGRHISTRVMGTFGYVAPEYAMTGHLLVKSDVYSYGVVLLELLTGRKPVDMTQLPGQENLVAWARPLLTTREGLEVLVDPSLGEDAPFDSIAKVAAIASMCVQPEVSHRPFMGEVVQALKLVCNECDEAREVGSRSSYSQDDLSIDVDPRASTSQSRYSLPEYDLQLDTERGMSVLELFSSSTKFGKEDSGPLRRYSSSGPLRTGMGEKFWRRIRGLSSGSISENAIVLGLRPGSH